MCTLRFTVATMVNHSGRVLLVEQQNLILPTHLSSLPVFSGIRVAQSLVLCVVFCRTLFVLFLLTISLSVLWCTTSDYPFVLSVSPLMYGFWLPLCIVCLSFDVRLLITPLYCLSVLWCTSSDYPFVLSVCPLMYGFWLPLCIVCLSFDVRLLITPLIFSNVPYNI
jgi:hypothetical protein